MSLEKEQSVATIFQPKEGFQLVHYPGSATGGLVKTRTTEFRSHHMSVGRHVKTAQSYSYVVELEVFSKSRRCFGHSLSQSIVRMGNERRWLEGSWGQLIFLLLAAFTKSKPRCHFWHYKSSIRMCNVCCILWESCVFSLSSST